MSSIILAQEEADGLLAMKKHRADEKHHLFSVGSKLSLDIKSSDGQEEFKLDLNRGNRARVNLQRIKMQTRGRTAIVLVRLDLAGRPHRNPNGEEIETPHLHLYQEEYHDQWAFPVPPEHFRDVNNLKMTLDDFMRYCNIVRPPHIEMGLFT